MASGKNTAAALGLLTPKTSGSTASRETLTQSQGNSQSQSQSFPDGSTRTVSQSTSKSLDVSTGRLSDIESHQATLSKGGVSYSGKETGTVISAPDGSKTAVLTHTLSGIEQGHEKYFTESVVHPLAKGESPDFDKMHRVAHGEKIAGYSKVADPSNTGPAPAGDVSKSVDRMLAQELAQSTAVSASHGYQHGRSESTAQITGRAFSENSSGGGARAGHSSDIGNSSSHASGGSSAATHDNSKAMSASGAARPSSITREEAVAAGLIGGVGHAAASGAMASNSRPANSGHSLGGGTSSGVSGGMGVSDGHSGGISVSSGSVSNNIRASSHSASHSSTGLTGASLKDTPFASLAREGNSLSHSGGTVHVSEGVTGKALKGGPFESLASVEKSSSHSSSGSNSQGLTGQALKGGPFESLADVKSATASSRSQHGHGITGNALKGGPFESLASTERGSSSSVSHGGSISSISANSSSMGGSASASNGRSLSESHAVGHNAVQASVKGHLETHGMSSSDAHTVAHGVSTALSSSLQKGEASSNSNTSLNFHKEGDALVSIGNAISSHEGTSVSMSTLQAIHDKGMPSQGLNELRSNMGTELAGKSDLQVVDKVGHDVVHAVGSQGFPSKAIEGLQAEGAGSKLEALNLLGDEARNATRQRDIGQASPTAQQSAAREM